MALYTLPPAILAARLFHLRYPTVWKTDVLLGVFGDQLTFYY